MRRVICIKEDNDPFSYGFKLHHSYRYYIKDDNGQVPATILNLKGSYSYFVINNKYVYDTHCAYDQEHFDEFFIDLQKSRNLKLEKIKQIT